MTKNRGITIAALIIAIIGLSIGFAAFSNTLTIRSSASVNPTNAMNVVFSSLNNGVGNTPVAPTLNTSATGFTATNATINGDTLSNLNVSFTAPGQSVTYSTNLYVYNDGNYQAQLTGITFEDTDGSEQGDENPWKHCTAITENVELANQATPSLVSAACEGINISVTIGTAEDVTPSSLDKTLNYQIIDVEGYLNASVTISYDGSYVDGPMSVTFGDIKIGATSAVNPALVVIPQEPTESEVDDLVPTSAEKTAIGGIEVDAGIIYSVGDNGNNMVNYQENENFKSLVIFTEDYFYKWACDGAAASADGIDAKTWYYSSDNENYYEYTGSAPISLSDFNIEDPDIESYLTRVIASFSNNG